MGAANGAGVPKTVLSFSSKHKDGIASVLRPISCGPSGGNFGVLYSGQIISYFDFIPRFFDILFGWPGQEFCR